MRCVTFSPLYTTIYRRGWRPTPLPNKYVKINPLRTIAFLIASVIIFRLPAAAHAQAGSAYDLVNAVNALRAAEGLAAYNVDAGLMAYAQEHSEYLAATHACTHIHQDGSIPQDIGLQENVACGEQSVMSAAIAVNEIWTDWGHRHILTGYTYGDIGAGWALSEDGQVHSSVNIRPRKDAPTYAPPAGTAAPFAPYGTSTPNESGSIVHVVSAGQTLWGIAVSYGTTMDEIRRINGLASDWMTVFPGQKLLIRKVDVTPLPPASVTPPGLIAAETNLPAVTEILPSPSASSQTGGVLTPSFTVTPPLAPSGSADNILILGLACLFGLIMLAAFVFGLLDLSKRKRP